MKIEGEDKEDVAMRIDASDMINCDELGELVSEFSNVLLCVFVGVKYAVLIFHHCPKI